MLLQCPVCRQFPGTSPAGMWKPHKKEQGSNIFCKTSGLAIADFPPLTNRLLCAAGCGRPAQQTGDIETSWDTCIHCTGKAIQQFLQTPRTFVSVQQEWCRWLPIQQQSVLLLAARGPDGISKVHPCKRIHRAYRACILFGAYEGHALAWGEGSDVNTFMGLEHFADDETWDCMVEDFFDTADDLAHHYYMHILHGAEILGYKHPDERFRDRWHPFYVRGCKELHLKPETMEDMNNRLNDWEREHWT